MLSSNAVQNTGKGMAHPCAVHLTAACQSQSRNLFLETPSDLVQPIY